MSILLVGLSGVGKTTIGRIISEKLDFKLLNFGDLMEAEENNDAFNKPGLDDQDSIGKKRDLIVKKIGMNDINNKLIIDAHCIIKEGGGRISYGFIMDHLVEMKVERITINSCSIRIRPDGIVLPCVYWPKSNIHINDIISSNISAVHVLANKEEFALKNSIPTECYCITRWQ